MYLCGSNQSRKETLENKRYNNVEEWANTLSHGAGILLGVIAGYFLLAKAAAGAKPKWAVACVTVYLFGMLSSYVSSTWYHGSRPGKLKELLRKFDHGAIYLHIAGTYTPFTLLVMRHAGGWGWGIFSFVWLSAIVGFILSFKKLKEHSNLETACYIAMGACILGGYEAFDGSFSRDGCRSGFLVADRRRSFVYHRGSVLFAAQAVYARYVPSVLFGRKHRAYHSDLADIVSKRKPSGRVHHFNTMLHHSTQKFLPPEPRNNVLSSAQGQ